MTSLQTYTTIRVIYKMADGIPVIDFSCYGLSTTDVASVDETKIHKLVAEVWKALSTHGFLYLKNHGIPDSTVKHDN